MKISIVHNFYRSAQPSGEDSVVRQDIEFLRSAGHDVSVFSRHSDDIAHMPKIQKAMVPTKVIYAPEVRRELRAWLETEQPDVVHLHNPFPLLSTAVLDAARDVSIPVVMTLHNYRMFCAAGTFLRDGKPCTDCLGPSGALPAVKHRCYRGSLAATGPLAISIGWNRVRNNWSHGVDRFIVMSQFAKDLFVSQGLDAQRITVKPHFVPQASAQSSASDDSPVVYLGRLSEEKGPDILINAWEDSFGPLDIIGDGVMREELEARVTERGLTTVTFLGSLPREDAMQHLARARLLVNPSRVFETFGLSVVEGFAHGLGAVIPDQGVFPELAGHDGAALTFRAGDASDLKHVLAEALQPGIPAQMGAAALERYRSEYSPAHNLEQLVAIYASVTQDVLPKVGS